MDIRFETLTGAWTGRYEYASGAAPVPFELVLTDDDGMLSGQVSEPNTFRHDLGQMLVAQVIGERAGYDVSFHKTYEGFDQGEDPIYEGALNGAMTRVDGLWRFPRTQGLKGRFMMVRAVGVKARKRATVEAEV